MFPGQLLMKDGIICLLTCPTFNRSFFSQLISSCSVSRFVYGFLPASCYNLFAPLFAGSFSFPCKTKLHIVAGQRSILSMLHPYTRMSFHSIVNFLYLFPQLLPLYCLLLLLYFYQAYLSTASGNDSLPPCIPSF